MQAVYLSVDITMYTRNSLVKFRFGVSPLAVRRCSRYKTHAYMDTIRPLRRAAVENEVHFTLCCAAVKDLRQRASTLWLTVDNNNVPTA